MSNLQDPSDHPHDNLTAGNHALENKQWETANTMYQKCLQHKHNHAYDKGTIRNHVTSLATRWHSEERFDDCIELMEKVLSKYLETQETRVLLRRIIDIVKGEKQGGKNFIYDPDRPGHVLSVADGLAEIGFS